MPELLTKSFCERCGTRFTFGAPPRPPRLGKLRVISRGLKGYVLSDDTSLTDSLADAQLADERRRSGRQLDQFHSTFNFCMTCRQYTCGNCWNTAAGRCMTCAPVEGQVELAGGMSHLPRPTGATALTPLGPDGQPLTRPSQDDAAAWLAANASATMLIGVPGDADMSGSAKADALEVAEAPEMAADAPSVAEAADRSDAPEPATDAEPVLVSEATDVADGASIAADKSVAAVSTPVHVDAQPVLLVPIVLPDDAPEDEIGQAAANSRLSIGARSSRSRCGSRETSSR